MTTEKLPYDLLAMIRDSAEVVSKTKTLRNRCTVVALVVNYYLELMGLHSCVTWGFYKDNPHSWVTVSGLLVDLTATQFSRSAPKVVVLRIGRFLPKPYMMIRAMISENEIVINYASPHMLREAEAIKQRVALKLAEEQPR